MQRRRLLILAVPLLLAGACSDDSDDPGEAADDTAGGEQGTIAVQLEPTEGIFVEGFELGLRFDDPESGDEITRKLWSEAVEDGEDFYTYVYEQTVPAGVVRVGADVNIGIGPAPEEPDLDVPSLPCELDVEVPAGETVTVQVKFDDSVEDCLTVVS